jgi:flagellar FliL protein
MSAAAPTADAGGAAPAKKGKKKLLIIVVVAVLLLAVVGAGGLIMLKKKAAAAEADGDDAPAASAHAEHGSKPDLKHPPTFLPLDPFVVNLADKEADRYAQIGITIEVEDAHFAEQMKAFMPAIRNGVLMILAHKTSRELLERAGKEKLADEILRESSRTMGIEVEEPDEDEDAKPKAKTEDSADADEKPKKKKKKRKAVEPNPIKHVHFSNFIVQ